MNTNSKSLRDIHCGPSCSGKTTVARILRQVLRNVIVFYQDDFYKPDSLIPIDEKTQLENWDCPESVYFDKLADYIEYAQKEGKLPSNYHSKEENNTHDGSSLITQQTLAKLQAILKPLMDDENIFILVDGFMLYWDERVTSLLDCKVFVTASYHSLKSRREKRQGYHTVEGYWVDPPNYFDKIVWPEYIRLSQHNEMISDLFTLNTDENSIEETALKVSNHLCKELL
ncbi:P-loop containing nucleoside triphosphate hydrolase protein [Cokeromyces recurvatus]|uniref:P-loop containing nucleoside triphosphate hydrolase protein n=1 Tax=Cokeromyces recurvatus TaxID=90255 RepID=UPI00221FF44C|nr:P-loop containing nucleoside triphosphate hydrolase protein [Cokeromyces recurvatus]KAI7900750.1 P-loop containing nucleoside triphosphate hydrolase protein [Cokeromyces recurvatus]